MKWLLEHNLPITFDNYLALYFLGQKPHVLDAEELQSLPPFILHLYEKREAQSHPRRPELE